MRFLTTGVLLAILPQANVPVLSGQQQDFENLGNQAMAAVRQGRFEDALPHYIRLLALDPTNSGVRFDYALALNRLGRARESLKILGTPRQPGSLTLAGANYRILGQTQSAIAVLRRAFALAPSPPIACDLGLSLLAIDANAEAERIFKRFPGNARCLVGLGLVAQATGRNDEAQLAYEKAATLEPRSADIFASLGDIHFNKGAYEAAASSYDTAIQNAPRSAGYRVKAARNLARLNRDEPASEHLRAALRLDPLHTGANLELARLPATSDTDRRKLLDTAIASDPTKADSYYQLMLLCQKTQDSKCTAFAKSNFEHLKNPPKNLTVEMEAPSILLEGPKEERRWGRYQFPVMHRLADGRLMVSIHVEADSATAYGAPKRILVSADEGATWREDPTAQDNPHGLRLRNGEWLRTHTPPSLDESTLSLPPRVGTFNTYNTEYSVFPLKQLPSNLRQIFFQRFKGGRWQQESSELNDPDGLRYTVQGKFPRIWWGDMQQAADGSLLAVTYPRIGPSKPFRFGSAAYRSIDQGKTWKMQSEIAYLPDEQADLKAALRAGFAEPAFTIRKDGSLYAVLRATDGNGIGPMYHSTSKDMGRTWSNPKVLANNGVLPRLLRLGNGVLVLSSGRPGIQLRFSASGNANDWTPHWELLPQKSERPETDTCSYTDLVALDRDSFLIVYSWFHKPDQDGNPRKTILARRIRVTKTTPVK